MNEMSLTLAIGIGLLIAIVPNFKNHAKKVLDKLLSVLFIKVTVSSSSNVSNAETTKAIYNYTSSKAVKWLSRGFMTKVDYVNDIGQGIHTCFDGILFFANVRIKGPYPRTKMISKMERGFQGEYIGWKNEYEERKPQSVIEITYYIFFWHKKLFASLVDRVKVKEDVPYEYCLSYIIEENTIGKLIDHKLPDIVESEYVDLKTKSIKLIDELDGLNVIPVKTNSDLLSVVQKLAIDMDCDLLRVELKNNTDWFASDLVEFLGEKLYNNGRKIIVYFDCRSNSLNPSFTYFSNYSMELFAYGVFESIVNRPHLIIVDEMYRTEPYYEVGNELCTKIVNNEIMSKLARMNKPFLLTSKEFGDGNMQPVRDFDEVVDVRLDANYLRDLSQTSGPQ